MLNSTGDSPSAALPHHQRPHPATACAWPHPIRRFHLGCHASRELSNDPTAPRFPELPAHPCSGSGIAHRLGARGVHVGGQDLLPEKATPSTGVHLISVEKVTPRALSIGAGFAGSTHASPCRCMSFCYPSRASMRRVNVGSTSATGPCFGRTARAAKLSWARRCRVRGQGGEAGQGARRARCSAVVRSCGRSQRAAPSPA